MASLTAYDAVKDFLVTTFGATYPVLDWEEIQTSLQQETNPFISIDGGAGTTMLKSIGTPERNWADDAGSMIIHVFGPSSEGLNPIRAISSQVRLALQFHHFTLPVGETMRVITLDPPSGGAIHDGLWHSMLMTLQYEHKYIVATA